jgi:hypothetical protein
MDRALCRDGAKREQTVEIRHNEFLKRPHPYISLVLKHMSDCFQNNTGHRASNGPMRSVRDCMVDSSFVQTPELSGVRAIAHFILFLICFTSVSLQRRRDLV